MYEFVRYRVADAMVTTPKVIAPDTTLGEAGAIFDSHDFNALPVVAEGRLVGVFTKLDFLKAFAFTPKSLVPRYDDIVRQPVSDFLTRNALTVDPDMPLTRVLQLMIETRCKSFPVADDGALVGMIAREDILRALGRAMAGEQPDRTAGS